MFEVACASCNAVFEYNIEDYIHLCPYCSTGFVIDLEAGSKETIGDHFVVVNRMDKASVATVFNNWIKARYHRPDKIQKEFEILGLYGVQLPFWVISLEAHTYWSGHSIKAQQYAGQPNSFGSKFAREDGRFSRRYRWATLARESPKEHWGLERLHHPHEEVLVDWDGFPMDESLGKNPASDVPSIYEGKAAFKFDRASGLSVMGVQVKEQNAIARSKDQIHEFHRRLSKLKVGTLYEHRTEIEIVGIQLIHIPFWIVRYAYIPKSPFRYLSAARERRVLINGYTEQVLEAEMPINLSDKVMANMLVCGILAIVSFVMSFVVNPLFLAASVLFAVVCAVSAWKLFSKQQLDLEVLPGLENKEPA